MKLLNYYKDYYNLINFKKMNKEKYITIDFHFNDLWREFEEKYNINAAYWVPDRFLKIISFLEEKYPDYEYHSFNPAGSGGYQPFVILKLKNKI